MIIYIHKATCRAWVTDNAIDCNCRALWLIRRRRRWEISRWIDGRYEPFMTCDTFEAARQLVNSMIWLRFHGLRSERNAR